MAAAPVLSRAVEARKRSPQLPLPNTVGPRLLFFPRFLVLAAISVVQIWAGTCPSFATHPLSPRLPRAVAYGSGAVPDCLQRWPRCHLMSDFFKDAASHNEKDNLVFCRCFRQRPVRGPGFALPSKAMCTAQRHSTTQTAASFFRRRRLKLRYAEQLDKALRRGVPLRLLEVSGDLRPPAYGFNPMLVIQFDTLLDSVISSPLAAPSRAARASILHFLSKEAGSNTGEAILKAAQTYKTLTGSLLKVVHPVLLTMYRRKAGQRAAAASLGNDVHRLALAIEGGAMRGCVSAGMAVALHHMGFADAFDAVFGSSAGSLVGAYFISRQLPYEGAQIYYDWLPHMGRKFLDLRRIGRGLGLGFLLDGDIQDFLLNRLGKPLLNLDVLLTDIVQRQQPLNWERFRANDRKQPLKIVTSGLWSQRPIVLDSGHGNVRDLPSLTACVRASMLLPGLAGPVVHLPAHPDSRNLKSHFLPLIASSALPRFARQAPCGLVSEPLADALLYEPVPYRSAIAQGYDQVLVLRSRPDGKRVGRLAGVEAAIENRLARRFFAGKHKLVHVYEYMKQRQHRIRYMKDMLVLNSATNNVEEIKVEDAEGAVKRGHAFAVALDASSSEIARIAMVREQILQGVRAGFARLFDVVVPDPQQRGQGFQEALKVFPESLQAVTETLTSASSPISSIPPTPPPFDDVSNLSADPKELAEYTLESACQEERRRREN
ncbi:patatin family protein, partial [Cystoisospora suis]